MRIAAVALALALRVVAQNVTVSPGELTIAIQQAAEPDKGLDRIPRTAIYAAVSLVAILVVMYLDKCAGTQPTRPRAFGVSEV